MIDIAAMKEELARLRLELARAEEASARACELAMTSDARRSGPRGGLRTSLNARWTRVAEYRNRLLAEVLDLEQRIEDAIHV